MKTTLIMTQDVITRLKLHAESTYPCECCGFLLGNLNYNQAEAVEFVSAKNMQQENREQKFYIDPKEYLLAEQLANLKNLTLIGIVHSHPDHPDKPSKFDGKYAWPGMSYIIISVIKHQMKSFRSWQISHDKKDFVEEPIIVKS